jgi:hypothetical protein
MMRSRPPQASRSPATAILNRLDARMTTPCHLCIVSTLVSDADTIQTPAITNSKNARHLGELDTAAVREGEQPHVEEMLVAGPQRAARVTYACAMPKLSIPTYHS